MSHDSNTLKFPCAVCGTNIEAPDECFEPGFQRCCTKCDALNIWVGFEIKELGEGTLAFLQARKETLEASYAQQREALEDTWIGQIREVDRQISRVLKQRKAVPAKRSDHE